MKKEYFDKFCTIVEGYREKISDNLVIGDSAFTWGNIIPVAV